MSKIITSPVKRFAGTVTLSDPLTFPQTFAVEDAISAARELGEGASANRWRYEMLRGVFPCVEEWHLHGVPDQPTIDTFPATPRIPSAELIGWLIQEVVALYQEAEEPIPNA